MDTASLALEHLNLLKQVEPYTKCSRARLLAMIHALKHIDRKNVKGAVVECGVWRGGNIIIARHISPHRTCWLYDTFDGMPLPQDIDVTRGGKRAIDSYRGRKKPNGKWSAVTRSDVEENLRVNGCWDLERIRMVPGMVEDTLLDPRNLPPAIALLRLDTDWHASTKIELEKLYPLLSPGGVLIVDDYGHWMGARKAVDDYFEGRGPKFWPIDYTAVMATKPTQA